MNISQRKSQSCNKHVLSKRLTCANMPRHLVHSNQTVRIIVTALALGCSSIISGVVSSTRAQEQAPFQAQNGWDKPRLVTSGDYGEGIVLDAQRNVIWLAGQDGIVQQSLEGGSEASSLSIAQRGVRRLVGQSAASGTALVWTQIDLLGADSLWGAWNGQTVRLARDVPVLTYASIADDRGAMFAYATLEAGETRLYVRAWGQPGRVVYRSKLSLGALTLQRTSTGLSLLFAEGYRITRDRINGITEEKFDAVLLEVRPGLVKRSLLGPAVFRDRRQRFVLYRSGTQLLPVWVWETEAEQRAAITSGVHNPRLVILQDGQIRPFAGDARLVGQVGSDIVFVHGSSLYGFQPGGETRASIPRALLPRALLLSPDTIDRVSLATIEGTRVAAWTTVPLNDRTSIYTADTRRAYTPSLLDRIAVSLGWNPWFAPQLALAQTGLALALGLLGSVLCLPLMWLLSSSLGRNAWQVCLATAWLAVLGVYMLFQRLAQAAPRGAFAPLFTSPLWLALAYLGIGTGLVLLLRARFRNTFDPLVGGLLVVFVAVALLTFSRAGFLRLS